MKSSFVRRGPRRRARSIVVVALAACLVISACSDDDSGDAQSSKGDLALDGNGVHEQEQ